MASGSQPHSSYVLESRDARPSKRYRKVRQRFGKGSERRWEVLDDRFRILGVRSGHQSCLERQAEIRPPHHHRVVQRHLPDNGARWQGRLLHRVLEISGLRDHESPCKSTRRDTALFAGAARATGDSAVFRARNNQRAVPDEDPRASGSDCGHDRQLRHLSRAQTGASRTQLKRHARPVSLRSLHRGSPTE